MSHLEEVFDSFGIIAIRFTTNAFDFFNLASLARRLDVFEMHLGILAEVDDRSEEVEEPFKALQIIIKKK